MATNELNQCEINRLKKEKNEILKNRDDLEQKLQEILSATKEDENEDENDTKYNEIEIDKMNISDTFKLCHGNRSSSTISASSINAELPSDIDQTNNVQRTHRVFEVCIDIQFDF